MGLYIVVIRQSGYSAETLAFKERVETDGGTIVSIDDIENAIQDAKDNDYYDDIKAWYSAQFGYKDDGAGLVSKWYDLSPNNNDAVASGAARPTWKANQQNGRAVMRWASGNYMEVDTGETWNQPNTVFATAKYSGNPSLSSALINGCAGSDAYVYRTEFLNWGYHAGIQVKSSNTSTGFMLLTTVFNGADSKMFFDGSNLVSGNGGTNSFQDLIIGAITTINDSPWVGDIDEIIIFNSDMSTLRSTIESRLTIDWLVPSGGTYQNETYLYQAKVVGDGGTIVSLDDIDAAITFSKTCGYYDYIKVWYSAQFGYKDDGSGVTSKLYDLSPNNNDATAATTARPTWTADQQNDKAGFSFSGTNRMAHTWAATGNTSLIAVAKGDAAGQTGFRSFFSASPASNPIKNMYSRFATGTKWGSYLGAEKPSSYDLYGTTRLMMQLEDGVSSNPSVDHLYTDNNAVEDVSGTARYSDANARQAVGWSSAADFDQGFKGLIFEVLGVSKQLSSDERTTTKTYLNTAWDIWS